MGWLTEQASSTQANFPTSSFQSMEKIGRYRVLRELGRGGMGIVYLAHDPSFGRDVAVKVLPRQLTYDDQFRARFEREARLIATLEHPFIVPVYDSGEEGDQPFIVMRYMAGGTLTHRLAGGRPMAPAEFAPILARIAEALDEAHQRGIVHRDLKPSNILFDNRGHAFLSDFGIAKLLQTGTGYSLTGGLMIGTPPYMSPEQATGGRTIDGRSDVHALGIVIYELLSGRRPFEADTPMQMVVRQLTEPLPALMTPGLAALPEWNTIISRAVARNPDDRYPTPGRLMADVTRLAAARPGPAFYPPGAAPEAPPRGDVPGPPPSPRPSPSPSPLPSPRPGPPPAARPEAASPRPSPPPIVRPEPVTPRPGPAPARPEPASPRPGTFAQGRPEPLSPRPSPPPARVETPSPLPRPPVDSVRLARLGQPTTRLWFGGLAALGISLLGGLALVSVAAVWLLGRSGGGGLPTATITVAASATQAPPSAQPTSLSTVVPATHAPTATRTPAATRTAATAATVAATRALSATPSPTARHTTSAPTATLRPPTSAPPTAVPPTQAPPPPPTEPPPTAVPPTAVPPTNPPPPTNTLPPPPTNTLPPPPTPIPTFPPTGTLPPSPFPTPFPTP